MAVSGDALAQRDLPINDADTHLVERLARGEPAALDELVALYQQKVTRLVQRLLAWDADVDDVVQEVFLAALKHAKRFRGQSALGTWLSSIAANKVRSWRRRRQIWWRWVRSSVARLVSGAEPPADAAAARHDQAQQVRQAVARLAARDREVIVLHYLEQHGVSEIAKILCLSRNAVEVRLHRARHRLRELLKMHEEIP